MQERNTVMVKKRETKTESESEVRVECAFKKMEPVENLKPNPRNPNKHPEEQITKLAKLIQLHGWRLPITVSNRSGFIVAGHGRYLAAQRLGLKEVPIDTQDFKNDAEELAVLVSDNVVADLATFDDLMMGDILRELETLDVDMEAFTALDADKIAELTGDIEGVGLPGLPDGDKSEFQQMTFTLHDTQAEQVKAAMDISKAMGAFVDSPNENSNGNALARICETFITQNGNG